MNTIWIDTRLNEEEMAFLNDAIFERDRPDWRHQLAGNISKSHLINDKDNWFYETALKKLTERIFYRNWDNYFEYHIEKKEPLPEFIMKFFWVNYQKQHEFNPPHDHNGLFSFVVFMKIPTHWKEQHTLPWLEGCPFPRASDFQFLLGQGNGQVQQMSFTLSPEDEGRMLFFPAWLKHQVFPFYGTEEERITISGNITLYDPIGELEEIEKRLKMHENDVKKVKKELKIMKEKDSRDQLKWM